MVAVTTMGWIAGVGGNLKRSLSSDGNNAARLGILAFETAKTMSRLVSLYKSLSEPQISNLRKNVMKSQGVEYLNSKDEGFLLSLACAERLEDLDRVATAVARLGRKCSDFGLNRFDLVYTDLKLGTIDLGKLEYKSKETEKRIDKMEILISATSGLYTSLEGLTELEISERKLKQWKKNSLAMQTQKMNFDVFDQKIAHQRKQVRHFKETSLWNQTFDKSVGQMARITCIVYARICAVFGPYIPVLPAASLRNIRSSPPGQEIIRVQPEFCFIEPVKEQIGFRSGPILTTVKPTLVRFYSRKSALFEDAGYGGDGPAKNNRVFHAAGPSTLGGCGLALRHANVILLAERYLDSAVTIGNDARENLYDMLPENLRASVRSKLGRNVGANDDDELLAEGWRGALTEMMRWLGPIAHDTMTWQLERNLEKKRFDSKPTVLLLQTLHFADKEKTEAAIAEVLVGLSYIYRCENRRLFE